MRDSSGNTIRYEYGADTDRERLVCGRMDAFNAPFRTTLLARMGGELAGGAAPAHSCCGFRRRGNWRTSWRSPCHSHVGGDSPPLGGRRLSWTRNRAATRLRSRDAGSCTGMRGGPADNNQLPGSRILRTTRVHTIRATDRLSARRDSLLLFQEAGCARVVSNSRYSLWLV